MTNVVRLENIKHLTARQRASTALDLWGVVDQIPSLRRELPIPARGYGRNPITGFRRLGRIARNADRHQLAAYSINLADKKRVYKIGMATAQVGLPLPNPTQMPRGIELSFWHSVHAQAVGKQVMRLLTQEVRGGAVPGAQEGDKLWMVTLPDDIEKAGLCEEFDMIRLGDAQSYAIGDDVTEPRQLWAI